MNKLITTTSILKDINSHFLFLVNKYKMSMETGRNAVIYRHNYVLIEFLYNQYDNELMVYYSYKDRKYNLWVLLNELKGKVLEKQEICITSWEYYTNIVLSISNLLKIFVSDLLNYSCNVQDAIQRIHYRSEVYLKKQQDKSRRDKAAMLIHNGDYLRAHDDLEHLNYKTDKDIKKLILLKRLIKRNK